MRERALGIERGHKTLLSSILDRPVTVAVAASFALGTLLRLWFVNHGQPIVYHPAEQQIYAWAVSSVQSGSIARSGPGLMELIELGLVYGLSWIGNTPVEVLGSGSSPGQVAAGQFGYLISGRAVVAILGGVAAAFSAAAAGTVVGGRSGRRFVTFAVSLLGGYVVALTPIHVHEGHFLSPAMGTSVGVAMALYFSLRCIRRLRLLRVLLAGLSVGFGAAMAPAGLFSLAAVVPAIALARTVWYIRLCALVTALAVAATTFVLLTPDALTNLHALVTGLRHQFGVAWSATQADPGLGLPNFLSSLWSADLVGPALVVAAALTVLLLATKRRRILWRSLVVIWLPLLVAVTVSSVFETALSTWLVLITPVLALGIALLAAELSQLAPGRWLKVLVPLLMFGILAPSVVATGRTVRALDEPRTEVETLGWFASAVPPGSTILRDDSGPPLSPERFRVSTRSDVLTLSNEGIVWRQTDYLVLSSAGLDGLPPDDRHRAMVSRYDALQDRMQIPPVACIGPEFNALRGPEIWVFAASPRARQAFFLGGSVAFRAGSCSIANERLEAWHRPD